MPPTQIENPDSPGGVVGDPYILRSDGSRFKFIGVHGSTYDFASTKDTRILFRVAMIPGHPADTYVDRVVIKTKDYCVGVGLNSVSCNGTSQRWNSLVNVSSGSVLWHTGIAGEKRVDFLCDGWRIGIIQDPGTNLAIHPASSVLCKVLHLGLFIDAHPNNLISGVFTKVNSTLPVIPSEFTVEIDETLRL